jgi:hypothetical protein
MRMARARTLQHHWRQLNARFPGLFLDPAIASGHYQVGYVHEATGAWTPLFDKDNLLLYTWGFIACQTLGLGDSSYKVNAAYLEYENLTNPTDPVSVPAFGRADGLDYYNGLGGNRDFLRVALAGTPTIDIAAGYEDYFIADVTGNRCKFTLQSAGTHGVLGRPFSEVNNSKACGIALVATPVFADRAQDVILARGYFDVDDQPLKTLGAQIGVRWYVAFK